MTVSFVSAGLLTLAQAISVIMGANIGTTLTAWIMSLGYNVDLTSIVFPSFFVGMVLIYKKRHRYMGDLLFGLAFLFLSLVMLSSTGKSLDLAHNEAVVGFFASFDVSSHLTIFAFVAIGTLITCIVQSSAAVMAITILLCSTGVLPIYLGIALVMGENIGTTATANLVALGSNTQARRAALAHLLFNVFGVIWVLIVFYPFVNMVCGLVGYEIQATLSSTEGDTIASVAKTTEAHSGAVGGALAMFHTCFNVINTSILIWLVPQLERVVCWILPEKQEGKQKEEFRLQYIHANLVQTPEISVLQAQKETAAFAQRVSKMFGLVRTLFHETDAKKFAEQFRQIRENFSATFTELFHGGRAELVLSDASDILNCDIDIIAQPPGKKLQLLSLLSGGEQALTAIALLFAILKLKPTAFCILDEIDTSLDEANVDNYAEYLKNYSENTQFIIITHRKGAMAVCDSLYGVSMEEKGVSGLISARFSGSEETA
jgi:phosphate:Na+ symporter